MYASIPVSVTRIGMYNDELFNPNYGNPFSDCKKGRLIIEKGSVAGEYAKRRYLICTEKNTKNKKEDRKMSNVNDFVIENGGLVEYTGSGGAVVIPDGVTCISGAPVFCDFWDEFELTLSPNMHCGKNELLSQGIVILNVPAGTKLECSDFGPNHSSFFAKLKEINVDPANPYCTSEDGVLYSKDKTILYACPAAHEGTVNIPDSVKQIVPHAFDGCKKLTELLIPATVEEIGERAFVDCNALKKIVLKGKDTRIGAEAFLRCSKVTTAGLQGTLKGKGYSYEFVWEEAIPENAFSGMNKLKKVVLPGTIKAIGKNAFKGCKSLEEINLPENVKCDKRTFKDCKNLSIGG